MNAKTIISKIKKLEDELKNVQKKCLHSEKYLKKVNKSNTGNYDPSSDHYWTDYHCEFCDKKWSVDQ